MATTLTAGALALAGCHVSDDDPNQGRVRTDCFNASPDPRPTRSEVERFASVKLPHGARGLRTSCQGFMDTYLEARFELPIGDLRAFLERSGFRARRGAERRQLVREDRPDAGNRRLVVRVEGGRARVRLVAFDT